jgi:hypothetical protein
MSTATAELKAPMAAGSSDLGGMGLISFILLKLLLQVTLELLWRNNNSSLFLCDHRKYGHLNSIAGHAGKPSLHPGLHLNRSSLGIRPIASSKNLCVAPVWPDRNQTSTRIVTYAHPAIRCPKTPHLLEVRNLSDEMRVTLWASQCCDASKLCV